MAKMHGLNGLTELLDHAESAPGDDPSGYSAAARGATFGSAALTQVLFVTEAGDASAICLGDIHQGQLGDCFLLSSMGEIARLQPQFISNMIRMNSNGSETVTLYGSSTGRLLNWSTMAFKSVGVTVDNVFSNASVNNGARQDVLAGLKEIWPQVIEKADATMHGGYSAIANGGSPVLAMEELTGHYATAMSASNLTLAALQGFVADGDMIVMDTWSGGRLPNALVSSHAYMFDGVTGSGAGAMVTLKNPWGTDQPTSIMFSQLTRGIAEVDIGHLR